MARLHRSFRPETAHKSEAQLKFWFGLSVAFAAVYGILGLQQAFGSEYVVQDDARQHVFWMQRFTDAGLFPGDLIADYFQSAVPVGYTSLYRLGALLGIDPMVFNKLLPIALSLITTGFMFGISMQILPIPVTGFLTTLLLNQNVWMKDDLASATPRAFLYPLFAAFLYFLLRRPLAGISSRSLFPMLGAIALQGLFYPQCVLISAGILCFQPLQWSQGKPGFSKERSEYLFGLAGLAVTVLVLLPFALQSSEFGPTITLAEARELADFGENGRSRFFINDPFEFWLVAERSGIFPALWVPRLMLSGLLLPIIWRFPDRFPLLRQVTGQVKLLPQIIGASVGLFAIAHLLLFKLQLPSRYTQHSFRFVMAVAAAIAITAILDALFRWANRQGDRVAYKKPLAMGLTALLSGSLIFYPSLVEEFPDPNYKEGDVPALYEFFQQQPKDTLIASLSMEVNNIPSFAQRSILVGREYAIPYQLGYYNLFRKRVVDLIRAQYSPNLSAVQEFIQQYGIDFWVLDHDALTADYVAGERWVRQHEEVVAEVVATMQQDNVPALARGVEPCSVLEVGGLVVLQADCLAKLSSAPLDAVQ
ncbi:MAG: hypothetical protein HC899_22695 [Leptolyngbyaceae cyanobacterium SM1_4_3]|nr:hypothetical protein [Leptolyngbyaceae cyanobacterium SM1_4_3]